MTARGSNAWWLWPGAVALVAAAVLDLRSGQLLSVIADAGTGLAFYVAGAVAYLARPASRSAWLLLCTATALAIGKATGAGLSVAAMSSPGIAHSWLAAELINACGWAVLSAGVALFATFPDGAYQRPYERRLVRLVPVALAPLLLLHLLGSRQVAGSQFGWVTIEGQSPLFVSVLAPLGVFANAVIAVGPVGIVPAVGLLIFRYRRFGREQREQIKWPLFALAVAAISTVVLFVEPAPPSIPFWLGAVQYMATFAVLPAGLGLGIVMYRGLDIEDVIRRSVIYGVLWATIGVLYVGVAAAFGIAVGQRVPLVLAVVLTIAGTLLFQPARRRLEQLADRLVFGPRLTGYQLISRLGERLQSTVLPEDVAGSVALAVRDGLGAAWVRVTLNRPQPTTVASAGAVEAGPPGLSGLLSHDGHVVGLIECGPKQEGRYDESDQHLLNTLGRQAALAIRNAQLSAELQDRLKELAASRARLVQAEDAGRRRLERDLHDGVQQQLVALLARLGLARNQLRRNSDLAEATVRESQVDAQRALEALQELARGIHPAILSDRGLVEAVKERADRMTVPVRVDTDGLGRGARFPEEVVGAAYFFVSEALANVLKHASASCVQVRLEDKGGRLAIEVQDDGRGFEPASTGLSGLRGLEDRIEALGGEMEVVSRPDHGAALRARLPIGDPARG